MTSFPPPPDTQNDQTASYGSPYAEDVARAFHETYERLAPQYGYATREASAVPWDDVPAENRALMVATADEVIRNRGLFGAVWNAAQAYVDSQREPNLETLAVQLAPYACCGSPNLCGAPCMDDDFSHALAEAERVVRSARLARVPPGADQ